MLDKSVFSELKEYQTDHLILLIGGNPLPNAVAVLCLAAGSYDQITGKITLIHSSQTQAISENLTNWLKKQTYRPIEATQIEQKSVGSLQNMSQIRAKINNCAKNSEDVGLHYTGGTKSMAVHAYRAIEQMRSANKINRAIFSYLNPDTLRMQFEGDDIPISQNPSIYVAQAIPFTIDDMGDLYKKAKLFSKDNPPITQPILPNSCQVIAEQFARGKTKEWNRFKNSLKILELNRPFKENGQWRNWKDRVETDSGIKVDLEEVELDLTLMGDSIRLTFCEELGLNKNTNTVTIGEIFSRLKSDDFCNIEFLMNFLKDGWLEHHVAHHLRKVHAQNPLFELNNPEIGLSAYIQNDVEYIDTSGITQQEDIEFEVDVVALRGYQLFIASCTVSYNGGITKSKLFEVYRRAVDIGGTQARVMLVCGASSKMKHKLKNQIRTTLDSHIGVFGVKDWPKLSSEIAKWMKKEIGEP